MKQINLTTKGNTLLVFTFLCFGLMNFHCAKTAQAFTIPEEEVQSTSTRIYVIRPYSYVGSAVAAPVYQNNSIVGRIGTKGYLSWDTQPGDILLQSGAEFIKIIAQPGKTYYFKLQPNLASFKKATLFKLRNIPIQEATELIKKLDPPKVKVVS